MVNEREVFNFLNREVIFNSFDGFRTQKRKEIGFYFVDRWNSDHIQTLINTVFLEEKIYLFYKKWNQNLEEITSHCQFQFDQAIAFDLVSIEEVDQVLAIIKNHHLDALINLINNKTVEELNQLATKLIFKVKNENEQTQLLRMLENANSWESIFMAIYYVKGNEDGN